METYQLVNDVEIPQLGFGTWRLAEGEEAYQAVRHALAAGYRHIDTAQVYGNETSVGQAIKDSGIAREDIFLTTKVWNDKVNYEEAIQSLEDSLQRLQVDYIDLVLIHWPNPKPLRENKAWATRNADVWKALEWMYENGRLRAIGVSNFMEHHFEALLETAQIKPMVNQVMLAAGADMPEWTQALKAQDVLVQAYSPLGSGTMMDQPTIQAVAQEVEKTVPQVAIRWCLDHGYNPLVRSSNKNHINSNKDVFDFKLTDSQLKRLDAMDAAGTQPNPDDRDF